MRERSQRHQHKARQNSQGLKNAISELYRAKLQSFTGEEEISEVTVNTSGLKARAKFPRWARGLIGVAISLAILIGAIAGLLLAWPK